MTDGRNWLVAWIVLAAIVCVGANLYTGSAPLDFSVGHLAIAGALSGIVMALAFVLAESALFIAYLVRRSRRPPQPPTI